MNVVIPNIGERAFADELAKFETKFWLDKAARAYRETFSAGIPAYKNTDDLEKAEAAAAKKIRSKAKQVFRPLYIEFYTKVIIHFAEHITKELEKGGEAGRSSLTLSGNFSHFFPEFPGKWEFSQKEDEASEAGRSVALVPPVLLGIDERSLSKWRKAARVFIARFVGKAIVGISNSTIRAFKRIVQKGTDEGEGTAKLARRLARETKEFGRKRATTWVKTELVAASNYGSLQGALESLLNMDKTWISTLHDGRTRQWHLDAHGQTVDKHDPFIVMGEELMYPGDPNASLKNRINCRCTVVYQPRDDGESEE